MCKDTYKVIGQEEEVNGELKNRGKEMEYLCSAVAVPLRMIVQVYDNGPPH